MAADTIDFSVPGRANDGLRSLASGLGDPAFDKRATSAYYSTMVSDAELLAAYETSWLGGKIVDIPAQDCFRRWRQWTGDDDQTQKIYDLEARFGLQNKMLRVKAMSRLWGGAALFIGTDQEASEPFDPSTIGLNGIKYLTVFTRHELTAGDLETDPASEFYGKPKWYDIANSAMATRIHPSRLVIQIGREHAHPWYVTGPTAGWGQSVLQRAMTAVKNADSTADNVASLVFEANVDVFGLPDFMANLSDPAYEKKIIDRYVLANKTKSTTKSMCKDAEETYERKQISFAQLPDVMQNMFLAASGAADIPFTRLFGQAPAGMDATGESDLRNHYDNIQAMQTLEVWPAMVRLDEALIRSALGDRPDDIDQQWTQLRQPNEVEIADIGNKHADIIEKLGRSGTFSTHELRRVGAPALTEAGVYPQLGAIVDESEDIDFNLGEDVEGDDQGREPVPTVETSTDAEPRTLYVRRDVSNAKTILAWARKQGLTDLVAAKDMHVTIVYSRTKVDWMKAGEPWQSRMELPEGGPRVVEPLGGAGAVLLFASNELKWRHEALIRAGAVSDYDEYQAHITLSYGDAPIPEGVEPYTGPIVLGPEIFEEVDGGR